MDKFKHKTVRRKRRHGRVRSRITGTAERPRVAVYRSLRHIYVQAIDDLSGKTICAASTREAGMAGAGGNRSSAAEVGKRLAERLKEAGVTKVAFDRGGFRYHGRIAALADAARAEGVEF